MQIPTYLVDTFTNTPFKGNPTSVCYLEEKIDAKCMQEIARELNFPVTAFLLKQNIYPDNFSIRYFTSTTEIPACGHATLASVKVVSDLKGINKARFFTRSDIIIETRLENAYIMMAYPKYKLIHYHVDHSIEQALGLKHYQNLGFCPELETLFMEVDDLEGLKAVCPDFAALTKSSDEIKEVVITAISRDEKYDYLLRSFCPWIGIDEDPVTGSVHSVLAEFWQQRIGKEKMNVYQASARGGELVINVLNDWIEIGGEAVIVLKGAFTLEV